MPSVTRASIVDLQRAYRAGRITVRGVVDAFLRRIDAYDQRGPSINAVVTHNERARATADRLDHEVARTGALSGPLHGVPILVKDQLECAGIETCFGSAAMVGYVPDRNATVISRLEDAGAIVLAKTTMPDFATSWFSLSSRSGYTRNPYDLSRDPGGSSAGTAAGVAADFATAGIGEDTGGSVRVPSSFTSLVGVRVTPGLISRVGMSPLVAPQDTAGPITRTVEDSAALLDVLIGDDPDDTGHRIPEAAMAEWRDRPLVEAVAADRLAGVRLGLLDGTLGSDDDADASAVNRVFRAAITALRDAGAVVEQVQLPDLSRHLNDTGRYLTRSHADIDGFLRSRPTPYRSLAQVYRDNAFEPTLDLLVAIVHSAAQADTAADRSRHLAQQRFQQALLELLARDDLDGLCFPDVQVQPPHTDRLRDKTVTTQSFPTNTLIASHTGLPAVSVPAGFTGDGMPVGLELVARPYHEPMLLGLAANFERATQHRRAPATTPDLPEPTSWTDHELDAPRSPRSS